MVYGWWTAGRTGPEIRRYVATCTSLRDDEAPADQLVQLRQEARAPLTQPVKSREPRLRQPFPVPRGGTPYGNAACRRWCSREHAPQDPPGETPGQRASYGTFAAVGCVREHGKKGESNPTATFFE